MFFKVITESLRDYLFEAPNKEQLQQKLDNNKLNTIYPTPEVNTLESIKSDDKKSDKIVIGDYIIEDLTDEQKTEWVCKYESSPQVEPITNVVDDIFLAPGKWEIRKLYHTENGGKMQYRLRCGKFIDLTSDYRKHENNEVIASLGLSETTAIDFNLEVKSNRCPITIYSLDAKHAKNVKLSDNRYIVRMEDERWKASDEQVWDDIILEIVRTDKVEEEPVKEESVEPITEDPCKAKNPLENPVQEPKIDGMIEGNSGLRLKGKFQLIKRPSTGWASGSLSMVINGIETIVSEDYQKIEDNTVFYEGEMPELTGLELIVRPTIFNGANPDNLIPELSSTDANNAKLEKINNKEYNYCFEDSTDTPAINYSDLVIAVKLLD